MEESKHSLFMDNSPILADFNLLLSISLSFTIFLKKNKNVH